MREELWQEFQELGYRADAGKCEAWHTPSGYRIKLTEAYLGVEQADRFSVSGPSGADVAIVVHRISLIPEARAAGIPYKTFAEKLSYRLEHGHRFDAYFVSSPI